MDLGAKADVAARLRELRRRGGRAELQLLDCRRAAAGLGEQDLRATGNGKIGNIVDESRLVECAGVGGVSHGKRQCRTFAAGDRRAGDGGDIVEREDVSVQIRRAADGGLHGKPAPVTVRRKRAIADVERLAGEHRAGRNLQVHGSADDRKRVVRRGHDRLVREGVLPVVRVERVAVARRARPRGGLRALLGEHDLRADFLDKAVHDCLGFRRLAREEEDGLLRSGVRHIRAHEFVTGDILDGELVSVEVEHRAAGKENRAEFRPVLVCGERVAVRATALREVRVVERVCGAVHGDGERHAAAVERQGRTVAAVGVAGDDGEAVPARRHLDRGGRLASVGVVVQHQAVVDEEGEVVVELLPDRPRPGLVRRNIEPPVEAILRPPEVGVPPRGIQEVVNVAVTHESIVAEMEMPPLTVAHAAAIPVGDASPLRGGMRSETDGMSAVVQGRAGDERVALRIEDRLAHGVVETRHAVLHAGDEIAGGRPRTRVAGPQLGAVEAPQMRLRRGAVLVAGEQEEVEPRVEHAICGCRVHRGRNLAATLVGPRTRHGTSRRDLRLHCHEGPVIRKIAQVVHLVAIFPAGLLVLVHDDVEALVVTTPGAEHYGIFAAVDMGELNLRLYATLALHTGVDVE